MAGRVFTYTLISIYGRQLNATANGLGRSRPLTNTSPSGAPPPATSTHAAYALESSPQTILVTRAASAAHRRVASSYARTLASTTAPAAAGIAP